jgi:protein Mpv17
MFAASSCRFASRASAAVAVGWTIEKTTAQTSSRTLATSGEMHRTIASAIQSSLLRKQQRSLFTEATSAAKPVGPLKTPSSVTFSTETSSSSKSSAGFVAWYESQLDVNPITTKAFTGSLLWGIGDSVAQTIPELAAGQPLKPYDYARTGRAVFFGFALHAPLSHVHFNFLEWMTVKGGFSGLNIPIFKTIMEQFVYWSWISNSLYHGAMGAMQGQGPTEISTRIADVLWETQKAQVTIFRIATSS